MRVHFRAILLLQYKSNNVGATTGLSKLLGYSGDVFLIYGMSIYETSLISQTSNEYRWSYWLKAILWLPKYQISQFCITFSMEYGLFVMLYSRHLRKINTRVGSHDYKHIIKRAPIMPKRLTVLNMSISNILPFCKDDRMNYESGITKNINYCGLVWL